MRTTVHWLRHGGARIRYELDLDVGTDVMSYRARCWKDGVFICSFQAKVERKSSSMRWTNETVELLAVIRVEATLRAMLESK